MILGVFGDSYADDSHETGWPTYISETFDKSHLRGVCGSSAGTAYLKFLEHVDELTHAVFVYSSTHRIPYLPEDIEHFAWYLGGEVNHHCDIPREKELKKALWSWQNILYNEELNKLLCNSIFKSVNDLCEEKSIQLVNVIPFDGYADLMDEYDTTATKFPVIRQLNWLSMMEGGNTNTYQKRLEATICMRPCHLNTHNNKIIERLILDMWENNNKQIVDVTTIPEINTSKNEWEKWFPTVPYDES